MSNVKLLLGFLIICFFSAPIYSQTTLISFGSTWSYDDNAAEPANDVEGDTWKDIDFNDSGWSSGAAELGYGDGDETTVISSSTLTGYFRHSFTVATPGSYGDLDLNLLYDDGAVVYLNGTEIWRVNMPTGPIIYSTPASGVSAENATATTTVTNTLVTGTNVLAVEVHQPAAASSDISFNFGLIAQAGTGPTDNISGTVTDHVIDCTIDDALDYGHPVLTVELYTDINMDGIADPGEFVNSAITDANGNYTISHTIGGGSGVAYSDSWDYVEITGGIGSVTNVAINSSDDDAEEFLAGGNNVSVGDVDIDNAIYTSAGGSGQGAYESGLGLRFEGLNIPPNSTITNAIVSLIGSTGSDGNVVGFTIKGELSDVPGAFVACTNGCASISSRTQTSSSVSWPLAAVNAGSANNTTDISAVIDEIVSTTTNVNYNQADPIALIFSHASSKTKNLVLWDPSGTDAPYINLDWDNTATNTTPAGSVSFPCCNIVTSAKTASSSNDAEENGGTVDLTSDNLEIVDGDIETDQTIGLRFEGLNIPQGSNIQYAYIQFTADADGGGTGATNLTITGEDVDNAAAFAAAANNISDRLTNNPTAATVSWNSLPTWVAGDAIGNQHSPDLGSIIQEIVDRGSFTSSSAISLIISGTGSRIAESANGAAGNSPELVVVYEEVIGSGPDYLVKVADDNFTGLTTTITPVVSSTLASGSDHTDIDFELCGDTPLCFAMDDQVNSGSDRLIAFNRINGNGLDIANPAATSGVEAIVFSDDGLLLYAYNDNGTFGSFDVVTGVFFPIGTGLTAMNIIDNSTAGGGNITSVTNDDVDGLAVRIDGNLWASIRDAGGSAWDILIVIDPATGTFVPDAFGTGVDGVRLFYDNAGGAGEPPFFRYDVDDIALNPNTGLMYVNVNGGQTTSYNCTVNQATGELSYVNEILFNGSGLTDIEGFTFTSNGLFYVTTGSNGTGATNSSAYYIADISTGIATNQVVLLGNVNGGEDGDFEGCDCLSRGVAALNDGEIGDFIFVTNSTTNQVPTGSEPPIPAVKVNLYRYNGTIYEFVDFVFTDVSGEYLFEGLPSGEYQVEVDASNFLAGGPLEGATQHYDPDGTDDDAESGILLTQPVGGSVTTDYEADFGYYSQSLPVEWLSFDVRKEGLSSMLNWKTAIEIDNDRFIIERSENGVDFAAIGQVKGSGTTNEVMSYVFEDRSPFIGMNYYRIEQVDYDGSKNVSTIRSLDFRAIGSIQIIPNPTSGLVSITLTEDLIGVDLSVFITDAQGKLVKVVHCNETCDLDITDLVRGMYQFTIVSGQEVYQSVRVAKL